MTDFNSSNSTIISNKSALPRAQSSLFVNSSNKRVNKFFNNKEIKLKQQQQQSLTKSMVLPRLPERLLLERMKNTYLSILW